MKRNLLLLFALCGLASCNKDGGTPASSYVPPVTHVKPVPPVVAVPDQITYTLSSGTSNSYQIAYTDGNMVARTVDFSGKTWTVTITPASIFTVAGLIIVEKAPFITGSGTIQVLKNGVVEATSNYSFGANIGIAASVSYVYAL